MKDIGSKEQPSPTHQQGIMKPSNSSTLNQVSKDDATKPTVVIQQQMNAAESNGPENPSQTSLILFPPALSKNQESILKLEDVRSEEDKKNLDILTVREPSREDVLFGRGGGTNFHQGNMHYRAKIKSKQRDYINARQRAIKTIIISDIIEQVHTAGGRFLKQDDKDKLWYEVDEKEVKKKTSQTLREGAPQWRKANGEWQRREQYTVSQPGMAIAPATGSLPVSADAPLQLLPQMVPDDKPAVIDVISSRDATLISGPDIIPSQDPMQDRDVSQPPPLKKAKTSSAEVTGLDLLSDVAFLHSVHEKKVKKEIEKPPLLLPCQVAETAVALQRWRVQHQSLLNSKR